MKREILFRGKRSDNGEWVKGYLIGNDVIVGDVVDFEEDYFITEFWYKVDPETVGQFTGLTDKNGTKIFDGDIISVSGVVNKLVTYIDGYACFCLANTNELNSKYMSPWQQVDPGWWNEFGREIEVIGNSYDNHELIK